MRAFSDVPNLKLCGRKRKFMKDQKKIRLDQLLADRGLASSRSLAQRMILAGSVLVNGQVEWQSAKNVFPDAEIHIKTPPPFVSRGGEKLAEALAAFHIGPSGWICADIGASTGGFTDCLLQQNALRVYTIDVGKGILDWKIRTDPRVVVREGENARFIENLPDPIDLVTIDASFISLRILLPVAMHWLQPEGRIIALIKPQFEAGRGQVGKGGVVRDADTHRRVLRDILAFAHSLGLSVHGLIVSPLKGPAGNIEFLDWWDRNPESSPIDELIHTVLPGAA
jgi:23S rRNA (cytidine1920-2'-O)/16S rRNA (cytidine1409-2'-O)-methyltransferase